MQTHSAFKNYKCKRCHKSFALKSYLNKHYESACFKDLPMPAIDTPPSTPSPPSLLDDACAGPLVILDQDYSPSSPSSSSSSSSTVAMTTSDESPSSSSAMMPTLVTASHHHVIHIPKPVFPYSSQQLIKV